MYSGTTLRPLTGRIIGAHQKINRLARVSLTPLLHPTATFPSAKSILHFEGINGPDAIKRKSPARDEPWHYYNPIDDTDTRLIKIMNHHYQQLVGALKNRDEVRAAFEAAWLAHAIVDGLTPAHHFPYEEKLAELRGGRSNETRTSLKEKLIMPGSNGRQMLANNWKMWGPKGLLNMHGTFEWGVAAMIAPLSGKRVALHDRAIAELQEYGLTELFKRKAKEIYAFGVYDAYARSGWTPTLARIVRRELVPITVHTVALAWYAAATEAGLARSSA
jgi:hypothetical protein